MTAPSIDEWLRDTRDWIEGALTRTLREGRDEVPGVLAEAMEYAVLGGGKRFRAALVRLVARWLGAEDDACEPAAVAVELVHAYSLVHDDLPCMDDDDWRRGRPSCHVRFGEANALLAGDALQAKAFEAMSRSDPEYVARCVRVLARAAGDGGMVGGQVLDLSLADDADHLDSIQRMHSMKTGALIAASAELGALAARCDERERGLALRWGQALGRCFQAVDDVLDVTQDRAALGKTPGKDVAQHKPTLVAALGLDGARRHAEEQAEAARRLALELGGPWSATGLQLVAFLLDRRS